MLLRIERAGARHLDHVAAPLALGAVQLDVGPLAAQPFPGSKWKILDLADADVAIDRDAFRLHEQVVGRLRPPELAETRPIDSRRLVPMRPAGQFMHGASLLVGGEKGSWMNALLPMRRAAQGPGRARTCRLGRASSRDPTTKAAAWTVGSRLKRVYARLRRAMDARPNLRPRVDQEAKSHNRKGFWPTD